MKISKISKTGTKYKITLEDNSVIKTYDDVIINNGLLYHKEVSLDDLNKINNDTNYYDIYYKTVNYITKKLRSEKEIIEFIDKNNVTKKDKEKVIKKLKEINLINDENYVKAYVSDRINLSSDGPFKIKEDLLKHNILEDVIDNAINKLDEDLLTEKLTKLINKKMLNPKYTGYRLKQKIVSELSLLGYNRDLIISIYENKEIDNSDLLKKEYNKLYKKLSLKYKGYELESKIKTKLYQKGFTMEEINSVQIY